MLLAGASAGLIPLIVLLAITLPHRYAAGHWAVTWVGFDIALLGCLALTAWLACRRRQSVVIFAFTTATLLICDAWFDVTTASGRADMITAIASALLLELPLAALLFALSHHLQQLTLRRAQTAHAILDAPSALHKLPLFGVPGEPAPETRGRQPGHTHVPDRFQTPPGNAFPRLPTTAKIGPARSITPLSPASPRLSTGTAIKPLPRLPGKTKATRSEPDDRTERSCPDGRLKTSPRRIGRVVTESIRRGNSHTYAPRSRRHIQAQRGPLRPGHKTSASAEPLCVHERQAGSVQRHSLGRWPA